MRQRLARTVLTLLLYPRMSSSTRNPCRSARESCRRVALSARHVSVHKPSTQALAKDIATNYAAYASDCDWNTDWHFNDPFDPALTVQYLFLIDTLNFCFWPTEKFEYEHLALGVKRAVAANPSAIHAKNLATMDEATLRGWFLPLELPNAAERVERVRELGEALIEEYDGSAYALVASCQGSAVRLVRRLLELLPGFRDAAVLDGRLVHFYKRAQILCGDLWAALGRGADAKDSPLNFTDLAELTMFADYRVPQILRERGVLQYDDALARLVDSKTELPFASRMEVEIRACCVAAVEDLRLELAQMHGKALLAIELDWILWNVGERNLAAMRPHHRTLTIFY